MVKYGFNMYDIHKSESKIGDIMTRNEAIKELDIFRRIAKSESGEKALDMAIKALETEPLTDTEQRIFLTAMGKEENVCKEVCVDGGEIDLIAVCHSIKRKVKATLWE